MKTKLTLTVRKSVIINAKKHAQHSGKSISRLFEEMFEEPELNTIKSEQQRAAGRLLKLLDSSSGMKPLSDKALLKKHISKVNMPDVFLDTDVTFDILAKREPHYISSIQILELAAKGIIRLSISESSLANLYYLCFDIYKIKDAALKLSNFIGSCEVMHGGKDSILRSLQSQFKDKEDALQYYTAMRSEADYFITRNKKDYKHAIVSLPVYTPAEFMRLSSKF